MPYLIQILLFLIKSYYSKLTIILKINKCRDTNEKYIQNIIYF